MTRSRIFIALAALVLVGTFFLLRTDGEDTQSGQEEEDQELLVVDVEAPVVVAEKESELELVEETLSSSSPDATLPLDTDRLSALFKPFEASVPFIETIAYAGRVDWLSNRAAYLGDYASHFHTSKHFISRSLHGKSNYLSDIVSKGDRFNVFKEGYEVEFHLVVDLSRLKMWVYYFDVKEGERALLKSYPICAGRLSSEKASGSLTPSGVFSLGERIAVYKKGSMGLFRGEETEMMRVFGQRWIPFDQEVRDCTAACKGIGLHGLPYAENEGQLTEMREHIGQYKSDGCIQLLDEDISELFALIITKPSFVHVVKDFSEATLPGKEKI